MQFKERQRPAIHDEIIVLVEIDRLPKVIRAPVVDEVREFFLLLLFSGRLETAPLGGHEFGFAVFAEFPVGV